MKMNLIYCIGQFGIVDTIADTMYVTDDYGNLVQVPYSLPMWYFQDV